MWPVVCVFTKVLKWGVLMISNQILQSTIDGLKNITRKDLSVLEKEGKVIATTEESMVGEQVDGMADFVGSPAESQLVLGYQYFKVYDNGVPEYIVQVKGEDEESYRIGKITTFQIQSLLVAYKERYDKDNFIKNLLLDNLLLVDIYSRAKKLHIENNVKRIVFLIETTIDKDMNVVEMVRNIFPSKTKDFVTAVDEHCIILVKEIKEKETVEESMKTAKTISDTISAEMDSRVFISIGTAVNDLKDVSRSYKEAKMALEVGRIFDSEKNIINYEQLGIGRLIYQLPLPLCRMFIKEVLHGLTIDDFDEETLTTVSKFFENNLNVSETSRQLYIHRNTLVYRLDKLQKMTGLDLRNFDDAIIFKITLMVSKYMIYMEKMSY
jgi:carbohydrate diacid regulator